VTADYNAEKGKFPFFFHFFCWKWGVEGLKKTPFRLHYQKEEYPHLLPDFSPGNDHF